MIKNNKKEITIALFLVGFSVVFYYLYGILLPFIIGIMLAFWVSPIISWIQKLFKNRSIATSIFFGASAIIIVLFLMFFTQYINRDFKRLNQSFSVLVSANQDNMDKTAQKVKEYIGEFYDLEELEGDLNLKSDSLINSLKNVDYSNIDTEAIKDSLEKTLAVFQSDEEDAPVESSGFGFLFMFFSTSAYFVLILYELDYFIAIRKKYFPHNVQSTVTVFLNDFNQSFGKYLILRTKIVFLLALIYLAMFIVLDMPGIIMITVLIIILSYIPYLQYLALIPLAIGSLVLSVENPQSFVFYFGMVVVVFVLASIIEELVLNPWIMEKNIGMNPVIMILAISIWSYLLGMPGTLIGIPMTSLFIIYFKRYLWPAYSDVFQDKISINK